MALAQFSFDQTVTDWVVSIRTEPWDSLWQLITVLGDTLTMTLVVIGVFVLAWVGNRIDLAALIVFGAISGAVLGLVLKLLFARQRPPVSERLIEVGGLSFPSGHSLNSAVIYGLTAVICYRLYPWVRAHPIVLAVAPALSIAIGLSRIYLGAHWLSDVLTGWCIGIVWVGICLVAHRQIARWIRTRTELQAPTRV